MNSQNIVIGNTIYSPVLRNQPTKSQARMLALQKIGIKGVDIPLCITLKRVSSKMSRKTAFRMAKKNPIKLNKEIARYMAEQDAT